MLKPTAIILLAGLLPAATIAAQRPPAARTQSTAWSQPVSPSVIGVFVVLNDRPIVMLWRGSTPGWFLGRPRGSSGGGGGGVVRGSERFGATTVDYQVTATAAHVQGVTVDLSGGANVLLIDHVDADPSQLTVTTINAAMPQLDRQTPLAPLLSSIPDAMSFLRCGEPLPDEQLKIWNRFVCDGAR